MILVACLFPVAVYCLGLGQINRRRHPLLMSAGWDFAGLLFAASGLLTFGIPGFLIGFSERGRQLAMFGRPAGADGGLLAFLGDLFEGLCAALFSAGHSTTLTIYFVVVVAGCALMLWRRQRQTAVYNVQADVFEEVLTGVLDAGRLVWRRAGSRYFIRPAAPEPAAVAKDAGDGIQPPTTALLGPRRRRHPATEPEPGAYLEVDASPAFCHVTLSWETGDEALRQQVEGELRQMLAQVRTRENAIGAWLLIVGATLMGTSVLLLAYAVLGRLLGR